MTPASIGDITDDKLDLARELGADVVIDARTQDVEAEVAKLGGADVYEAFHERGMPVTLRVFPQRWAPTHIAK